MEYGSYHAIVACAAAGAGIAFVPRSVIRAVRPKQGARFIRCRRTWPSGEDELVWRTGHRSAALDALRARLPRAK